MFNWIFNLIPAEARAEIESKIAKFESDWEHLLATLKRIEDKLFTPDDGGPPHA